MAFLVGSVVFFGYGNICAAQDGGEITKENWRQHPKIKEVRNIYQSVNAGRKRLRMKKRTFEYCEPHEDSVRILGTDASGRVRFYQKEGGSEDSALKFEHYYDEAGRLRFVLITGGAVNGSKVEHRIYFDADGKRIWEIRSFTDPGYTWPEVWPDEQLQISDPAAKFSSDSPCPEIKARAGGRQRARG
ncbi:MAG TPA: hypothetical protein VJ715_10985 [Pyrinomonadaceae bacterium]|nr:hypothetical protein [Pyrinomonadaceae bacterium]